MAKPIFWMNFCKAEWKNIFKLCLPPLIIAGGTYYLLYETAIGSNSIFNVRRWPSVRSTDEPGQYVHQTLTLAVVTLICINTFFYCLDSFEDAKEGRSGVGAGNLLALYFALFAFAVLWGVEIIVGFFRLTHHEHELMALFVFFVFSLLDLKLGFSVRTQLKTLTQSDQKGLVRAQELALKEQSFFQQLLFVDMPVVLGILTVLGLSFLLDVSPSLGQEDSAQAYMRGFATGAVVMHMAASQAIYFLVCLNFYLKKFKLQGDHSPSIG